MRNKLFSMSRLLPTIVGASTTPHRMPARGRSLPHTIGHLYSYGLYSYGRSLPRTIRHLGVRHRSAKPCSTRAARRHGGHGQRGYRPRATGGPWATGDRRAMGHGPQAGHGPRATGGPWTTGHKRCSARVGRQHARDRRGRPFGGGGGIVVHDGVHQIHDRHRGATAASGPVYFSWGVCRGEGWQLEGPSPDWHLEAPSPDWHLEAPSPCHSIVSASAIGPKMPFVYQASDRSSPNSPFKGAPSANLIRQAGRIPPTSKALESFAFYFGQDAMLIMYYLAGCHVVNDNALFGRTSCTCHQLSITSTIAMTRATQQMRSR